MTPVPNARPRPHARTYSLPKLLAVLELIAEGNSNREIGRRLGVSEDAIKSRVASLFGHLGARDRAHAVALGYQRGYLTRPEVVTEP